MEHFFLCPFYIKIQSRNKFSTSQILHKLLIYPYSFIISLSYLFSPRNIWRGKAFFCHVLWKAEMGLLIQRIISSPPPLPWLPLILLVMLTERKAFFVHYLLLFHASVTLFFTLSVIRCTIVKMYYFNITKNFIYLFFLVIQNFLELKTQIN